MLPMVFVTLGLFVIKQPVSQVWRHTRLFFLVALIFAAVAWGAASDQMVAFSHAERLQLVSHGFMFYIGKTVAPFHLSCVYPFPKSVSGKWPSRFRYAPIAALLTLLWMACVFWYDPIIGFGLAWYLLHILPVLQWVTVGLPIIACDHFMYLPLSGLCLSAGRLWVYAAPGILSRRGYLGLALGVLYMLILAHLTFIQVGYWETSVHLFQNTLKLYPGIRVARKQLGLALMEKQRWDEAAECFDKMIRDNPEDGEAYLARSGTRFYKGNSTAALEDAITAVKLLPGNTAALRLKAVLQDYSNARSEF